MKEEIAAAVLFMSRLIRLNVSITKEKAEKFSEHLTELLLEKFKDHWYAENPQKGQAHRCIRINPVSPVDPLLNEAATLSGLNYSDLRLPTELTLWIDPQEVSCRFGETHGVSCMLLFFRDGKLQTNAHKVDIRKLVEEQTQRDNKHINIVTTRINMPHPQNPQSLPFDQTPFPTYTCVPKSLKTSQPRAGFNPNPWHIGKPKHRQRRAGFNPNPSYTEQQNIPQPCAGFNPNPSYMDKHKKNYRWVRGKKQNRADQVNVGTKCSTNCSNKQTGPVKVATKCITNSSNKQTDTVKVGTACTTNRRNKQTDPVEVGTTCSTNSSNEQTDPVEVSTTGSTNSSNEQTDPVEVGTTGSTNSSNEQTDPVEVGTTGSTNSSNEQTDPVEVGTTCSTNGSNEQTDPVEVGTTCSTNSSNEQTDPVEVGTTCSTNGSNEQTDHVKEGTTRSTK
ncbi:hypothetical protein CHS0354_014977 [Potamilus streckersoni]|uniref:Anti-proliferative protein domain-containing protein n=1 Tax=Potamilus streckersoni TaxID=2493646 RepID=A0AAE0SIA9_9BIVA|nr:hypothetical protein CHS0354_014977 [Potamilus streckersoni]